MVHSGRTLQGSRFRPISVPEFARPGGRKSIPRALKRGHIFNGLAARLNSGPSPEHRAACFSATASWPGYFTLLIRTTSLLTEPRARNSCLPSADQAKWKFLAYGKVVACLGGW